MQQDRQRQALRVAVRLERLYREDGKGFEHSWAGDAILSESEHPERTRATWKTGALARDRAN